MIVVGGKAYELVQEHKDAWKPEAFKERYSEVLDRYDYIVGDWGYNQLRLKGFFKEGSSRATKDSSFASIQDYLQEYCNFGCAYFVLERASVRSDTEGAGPGAETPAEADAAASEPAPAAPEAAGEGGAPSAKPERQDGMQRIAGVAGGMGFSDRKPYSWREHQSTSRTSRNADRAERAGEAAGERASASAVRQESGAGGPRREPRPGGDARPGGRSGGGRPPYEGKPRFERGEDGRGAQSGGRPPVPGGQGEGRPGEGKPGGGRKFHKGPRSGGGPGAGAGPKGGRGARPDGGRNAQASPNGGRDRAQQRHHHKPQRPPQQPQE